MMTNNNATSSIYGNNYHNNLQDNDIRDYISFLEKAPEKDKYICPVCGGNDLSINQDGKFTCYSNECDRKEIYIAAKKLAGEYVEPHHNRDYSKSRTKGKTKQAKSSLSELKHQPVHISEDGIQLAQLPSIPTDIPTAVKPDGIPDRLENKLNKLGTLNTVERITYQYSENTWLDRYEWVDKSQEKGRDKTFIWGYRKPETGEIKRQKVESVPPYRFSEVLDYASGKSFLAVEGEKCIEACRSIGLVATDTSQLIKSPQCLDSVKEKDITVVIIPDKDKAGIDKAEKLEQACLKHRVKYLILNVYQWLKDKPDKYDIADMVYEPNMNAEEIIEVLNRQIREALNHRGENEAKEKPTRHDTHSHISEETEQFPEIPVTRLNKAELIAFIEFEYGNSLKFNLRKQQIELNGVPIETSKMHIELAKKYHIEGNRVDVKEIFQTVAKDNQYDPVKTWFEEIKLLSDKGEIQAIAIDNLSTRYFGTTDPLCDIYLKKCLISAVARVLEPGCKVDTVLVLQGKQGCGKSTFFETLGKGYYGSSMSIAMKRNNEADELATASKSFINEYAEFEDIVSSKKSGDFKGFISRSVDTYRKPYAEAPKEHPRNFIIVGTTNEEEFLKDPTGNRRFWVIPVAVDKIDTELLQKEIEGIWSSAINAYLGKQPWHLTELEEQARKRLNQKFQHSDEWENPIGDYLQQLETKAIASNTDPLVSIKELLKVIGQNADDRNSQHRVARILISMGWKKLGQRTINGLRQYVWTNPSILLNPAKDKSKDKQPKTTDIQGLSYPTYPTYPNLKTKVGEKHNTISEEENTSHETCKEVSSNKISRISKISNPSQSKASNPTQPQTQPQEGLSTQVVIAQDSYSTESAVDDSDVTAGSSSENTEPTAKTINEEKKSLQLCDLAGNPLKVGDYFLPSEDESAIKDWEKLSDISNQCDEVDNNPVIEIIAVERRNNNGQEEFFVVGRLINGVQFFYKIQDNTQHTGSNFLIEKRIEKMVNRDGQWVAATLQQ